MSINPSQAQGLSHLEFIARQVVEGFITGLHKSPFHGFSVEFAEHRIYNTGEPTRHIDWKLFGRTDKLFTKRYEEETNLRCQLVIDQSASMNFPLYTKKELEAGMHNKLSFSVYSAAAIMALLKMQRDAVGLSLFGENLDENIRARSSGVHHKLLLHKLEECLERPPLEMKPTSAASSLHQIAESVHKRSLIIIFSDMFETGSDNQELFHALQHLRYNKHEVILFHVTDKKQELDFSFDNRPYRFVDVESGEEVKVHAGQIRESYLKAMGEFKKELELRCAQYRIDFVEADCRLGYRQVLMPYLLKRQRML